MTSEQDQDRQKNGRKSDKEHQKKKADGSVHWVLIRIRIRRRDNPIAFLLETTDGSRAEQGGVLGICVLQMFHLDAVLFLGRQHVRGVLFCLDGSQKKNISDGLSQRILIFFSVSRIPPYLIMECPITLDSFREPRVLDCGHTIDRAALDLLRERRCPVCRCRFFADPAVNWALVSVLGLKIEESSHLSLHRRRKALARSVKDATTKTVDGLAAENRARVLEKIMRVSHRGGFSTYFSLSELHVPRGTPLLCRENVMMTLENQLHRMGFRTVTEKHSSWWLCGRCRSELRIVICWRSLESTDSDGDSDMSSDDSR